MSVKYAITRGSEQFGQMGRESQLRVLWFLATYDAVFWQPHHDAITLTLVEG